MAVTKNHNPYAAALDGLVIEDPVAAFFDFCRAREAIRIRREAGEPAPWSDDPIFQNGRFLNIFREDDRGTKALFRFVESVKADVPALIHALFFARWCNKQATLDALSPDQLHDPKALTQTLMALPDQPWCNVTAYPVGPIQWAGRQASRLEASTTLFAEIKDDLADLVYQANGDVVAATQAINAHFEMDNDFPIFMAVMDIAWFQPEVIHPASPVPTGIGAVAFLDRLQAHLKLPDHHATCDAMIALQAQHWPEAKRPLQPIDIEYLSCECRKYYSYKNGTKSFEGKNRFRPGASARLQFELPTPTEALDSIQTEIHVIAGGPCSGKTTLLEALQQRGHAVVPETSRTLLESAIAQGQSAQALRADPVAWQMHILKADHALFDGLPTDSPVFTDTSFIEDIVFSERAGIELGPNAHAWLKAKRYKTVFFLDPLPNYEQSDVRLESQAVSQQISEAVHRCYEAHGYTLVGVPAATVQERTAFIEAHLASSA